MRKWFAFALGLAVTGCLLFFALQKSLTVIRKEKAAQPITVPATPLPGKSGTIRPAPQVPNTASTSPVSSDQGSNQGAIGAAEKSAVPVKQPTFLEGSFKTIQLYRAANQKFLRDQTDRAERLFQKAFQQSSSLKPTSKDEERIKNYLVEAIQARVEATGFFKKIFQSSSDPNVGIWWEENIRLLKKANQSVTQAILSMSREIRSREGFEGGRNALLMQDLEKNAKGILIVAKSAQS